MTPPCFDNIPSQAGPLRGSKPFSHSRAGISRPAVCAGTGAAICNYIFRVLLLTTRPSPSNYDIIENDLKPNVRALLSESVFTENSCLNRHLEGIRITFFFFTSQCVSVSLSVCKCAYMRGLAIWAPRQTISLFWMCSLKSLGADRSQEQRGKRALASFLLSLRAFRLQPLWQADAQLAATTVPEACRGWEKPREPSLDRREKL